MAPDLVAIRSILRGYYPLKALNKFIAVAV